MLKITSESSFKTIESDDGSLSRLPANFTALKNMTDTTTRRVFLANPFKLSASFASLMINVINMSKGDGCAPTCVVAYLLALTGAFS